MTAVGRNTKFVAVFLGNLSFFEFQLVYPVFNCCRDFKQTPVLERNVRTLASSAVFYLRLRLFCSCKSIGHT
jgi:hypothetical protein